MEPLLWAAHMDHGRVMTGGVRTAVLEAGMARKVIARLHVPYAEALGHSRLLLE